LNDKASDVHAISPPRRAESSRSLAGLSVSPQAPKSAFAKLAGPMFSCWNFDPIVPAANQYRVIAEEYGSQGESLLSDTELICDEDPNPAQLSEEEEDTFWGEFVLATNVSGQSWTSS
jgi:hypothetical protein